MTGNVMRVTSGNAPPGLNPPRQARSREALRKILAAAEDVLADTGIDDFTMAVVAERAGMSVGAIYRRFEGKEQLLNAVKDRMLSRLEDDLAGALDAATGGLRDVVQAFTRTLADDGAHTPVVTQLVWQSEGVHGHGRFRQALENAQRRFLDAATAHLAEVRRANPEEALVIVFRTIIAARAHRKLTWDVWPDGIGWDRWSEEVADMALLYLTTPGDPADRVRRPR